MIVDNKLICNKDPEMSQSRATFDSSASPFQGGTVARHNSPAKPEQLQLFFSSRYLNIEQVAEIIGVPKSFIYRRTARGHGDPIPHYRLGGHLRFKLDDVEEWIERHRNEPERESPTALVAAIKERSPQRSTEPLKQQRIQRRMR